MIKESLNVWARLSDLGGRGSNLNFSIQDWNTIGERFVAAQKESGVDMYIRIHVPTTFVTFEVKDKTGAATGEKKDMVKCDISFRQSYLK